MTAISITYCKPRGYEKRAVEAAEALQRELGVAATLIPGRGGIFEVKAGDQVVARRRLGRFPDPAEIVAAAAMVILRAWKRFRAQAFSQMRIGIENDTSNNIYNDT